MKFLKVRNCYEFILNKNMKIILILLAIVFVSEISYSQCSDAGVCFLGHKSESETGKSDGNLSLITSFATSDKETDVKYYSIKAEGSYNLSDDGFISASLPLNFISGPLGNKNGLGDIILSYNHKFYSDKSKYFLLQAGFKFATGPMSGLPMSYQVGTGTNDFLLGASFRTRNIILSAGYQQPLNRNNHFTELKRAGDIFIKTGYDYDYEDFSAGAELLAIKRLAKSTSVIKIIPLSAPQTVEIDKSDVFQINLGGRLGYNINPKYKLELYSAIPLLKRDDNSDGLKRTFTIQLAVIRTL